MIERLALLVIDVQNGFISEPGELPVPGGADVIPVINALLPRYPIRVATQDWHPRDHGSFASRHPGKKPFERGMLGDVATTYIGIRTLQTQIQISEENIVKQKKALAIARAQYEGGTATKLDVYQAENVLGQTESTIPQLTSQLNQGFNALALLLRYEATHRRTYARAFQHLLALQAIRKQARAE